MIPPRWLNLLVGVQKVFLFGNDLNAIVEKDALEIERFNLSRMFLSVIICKNWLVDLRLLFHVLAIEQLRLNLKLQANQMVNKNLNNDLL